MLQALWLKANLYTLNRSVDFFNFMDLAAPSEDVCLILGGSASSIAGYITIMVAQEAKWRCHFHNDRRNHRHHHCHHHYHRQNHHHYHLHQHYHPRYNCYLPNTDREVVCMITTNL